MIDLLHFENKVALVTGGGRGIGAAITRALCDQGVRTAITYRDNLDAAMDTIGSFPSDQTLVLPGDSRSTSDAARVVARTIDVFGRLDYLIINAGITRDRVSWKLPEEDWDAVIDTNLKGTFAYVAAAAPHMRNARSGRIVTISSINGIRGKAGQGAYAASKGGIIAFTRSMAKELGPRGITVNSVAPGFIETAMTRDLPEEIRQTALNETALNKLGQPEDVAGAVLFLCSDMAGHITGQVLKVDGGQYI